jgi:hypothetical protein
VIAGVQYTVNQAISRKRPSVANMSLGGGRSTPVNEAVNGTPPLTHKTQNTN